MIRAVLGFGAAAFGAAAFIVALFGLYEWATRGVFTADFLPCLFWAPISAVVATLMIWSFEKGAWGGAAIALIAHPILWLLVPFTPIVFPCT